MLVLMEVMLMLMRRRRRIGGDVRKETHIGHRHRRRTRAQLESLLLLLLLIVVMLMVMMMASMGRHRRARRRGAFRFGRRWVRWLVVHVISIAGRGASMEQLLQVLQLTQR